MHDDDQPRPDDLRPGPPAGDIATGGDEPRGTDAGGGGGTGSTHSEIGAQGGGSPGAQAAAAKRAETGEDTDLAAREWGAVGDGGG